MRGGSERHSQLFSSAFVCCCCRCCFPIYTYRSSVSGDVTTGVSFNAPLCRQSWGQPTGSGGGVQNIIILRHACVVPLFRSTWWIFYIVTWAEDDVNPLNPELNPICYLLALLGAHYFLHVSRIRVKSLTIRLLMSHIYIYIYIYIYIWSTHSWCF